MAVVRPEDSVAVVRNKHTWPLYVRKISGRVVYERYVVVDVLEPNDCCTYLRYTAVVRTEDTWRFYGANM